MNKTNLEMFKMSKAQMNNVNGGRKIKCVVLDVEHTLIKEAIVCV